MKWDLAKCEELKQKAEALKKNAAELKKQKRREKLLNNLCDNFEFVARFIHEYSLKTTYEFLNAPDFLGKIEFDEFKKLWVAARKKNNDAYQKLKAEWKPKKENPNGQKENPPAVENESLPVQNENPNGQKENPPAVENESLPVQNGITKAILASDFSLSPPPVENPPADFSKPAESQNENSPLAVEQKKNEKSESDSRNVGFVDFQKMNLLEKADCIIKILGVHPDDKNLFERAFAVGSANFKNDELQNAFINLQNFKNPNELEFQNFVALTAHFLRFNVDQNLPLCSHVLKALLLRVQVPRENYGALAVNQDVQNMVKHSCYGNKNVLLVKK